MKRALRELDRYVWYPVGMMFWVMLWWAPWVSFICMGWLLCRAARDTRDELVEEQRHREEMAKWQDGKR